MEFEHVRRHAASQLHRLRMDVQMICDVLEYAERKPLFSFSGAMRFAASALRRVSGRSRKLDLESTSNYMKKDLGFLDGRMPRCDDKMLR
ncbi:hypothetical protein [Sinorhizobium fredii]|uniref:Uncharacterized protein n=1 Tax=Rhizobium fredii TaxID=380 RepID=A0A844ACP3_RHIFR|nr:hypothetical protein [Sinorhizobium fredii]MQW99300.1 hypothetical protein [Sinorhizobium fredii]MQX09270.1 hypothetical protein [Sinorhizobium fredii]UTY50050.1 hypothetical protein EPK84_26475 [Sinorhizobium fredii]